MASELITLVNALVDHLNGLTWDGTTYEARRCYAGALDEQLQDADGDGIKVDVIVPEEYDEVVLSSRGSVARTVTIDVVIRRKFASQDNDASTGEVPAEQVAELIELGEVLSLGATYDRMTGAESAAWMESEHAPIYRRDHLRQMRQFTGAVALTFEIHSDL